MNKPIKVLLHGFIDTNVIDGSAFFLPAMANMLTRIPNLEVDLLLARPLKRLTVLREILRNPRVNIIDPFSSEYVHKTQLSFLSKEYLTHEEDADLLVQHVRNNTYDVKIIRSTQVAALAGDRDADFGSNLCLYVTGITDQEQTHDDELAAALQKLSVSGTTFLVQTKEMLEVIQNHYLPGVSEDRIVALYPMIPDTPRTFDAVFQSKTDYSRFVYTGKFVDNWNPREIISGFNEVHSSYPAIKMDVAGDQFRRNQDNETFVEEVKYLLQNSPDVTWHGGLDREAARRLIQDADVGISWRGSNLDHSLELSTKLLEYGSLGRPCIINRTPMHESIFGEDYPLYANSMTEYTSLLTKVVEQPKIVEEAARVSFTVAENYTYSKAAIRLLPYLMKIAQISRDLEHDFDFSGQNVVSMLELEPREFIDIAQKFGYQKISGILGPYVWFRVEDLDSGLDDSSAEQDPDILDFYVQWRASLMLEARLEETESINSHLSTEPSRTASARGSEIDHHSCSREINGLRSEIRTAGYRIETLSAKLRDAELRLAAIRNSRLGKIQVHWWARRNNRH